MPTVTISLPASLKEFVDDQLENKGFGNVSEYFRSLLREAQAKDEEARLKSLLLEGLASGEDLAISPEFWGELKAEALQISREHRVRKKR